MNKKKQKLQKIIAHAVLIFFALTALLPLSLVLINSFKKHADIVRNPLALPRVWDFSNYATAWKTGKFAVGFTNSFILSGFTILVVLICASLAAYVIAGKKVRAWPLIMMYFMVAMTVPIQLFMFPLYFVFANFHLIGNIFAVSIILAAVNMPISVFLMRTFFLNVPAELEEAAKIDGAGTIGVLRHIMIPLVSSGLVTVAVIVGLQAWNEFLITSTFLQGETSFTATLGFLSMNGTYTSNMGLMMAAAVIMIAPIIIFFLGIQRYFIDGLVSGAVKG
jgi:raffinose/stachyose/melibiose transport system permease protein